MKPFAFVAALLCLPSVLAKESGELYPPDTEYFAMMDKLSRPNQWEYRVTKDGVVFRVTPTPATEGTDIDYVRTVWQQSIAKGRDPNRIRRFVYSSDPAARSRKGDSATGAQPKPSAGPPSSARATDITPPIAGTPEKDKEEAKTPDKGKDEGNKEAEPDWPPKEVAPAADKGWEPTEEELEQLRKLCAAGKNSGDNKKFDEARDLSWKMLRRLARVGDKLPTTEWAKRLDAAAKIREAMKDAKSYSSGNGDVCNVMVDDIATEEKHPAMFAKLKWMYDNRAKYDIHNRYYRLAVYKYIENHPDAFKDEAAKKLFCQQLIKGGVNDPGLKELSESFK